MKYLVLLGLLMSCANVKHTADKNPYKGLVPCKSEARHHLAQKAQLLNVVPKYSTLVVDKSMSGDNTPVAWWEVDLEDSARTLRTFTMKHEIGECV